MTGKPRKGRFKRAFYWPDDKYDYAVFFRVAQVAVRNKKTVIKTLRNQGQKSDQSLNVLACPIFLKRKLLGAVIIAMAYRSLALQNVAVQQVQNGVRWLEAMLEVPYDPLQAAKSKLFGQRRPSLQTAASLAIILLVGLVLISPLLRIPVNSETEKVTRRNISVPQKINSAKDQNRIKITTDTEHTVSVTDEQSLKPKDTYKAVQQSNTGSAAQQVQASARPDTTQVKTASTISPEIANKDAPASSNLDNTKTTSEVVAQTHSIEIGPIIKASHLKRATQLLQKNGFEYQQKSGVGSVKVIRLREGVYSKTRVKERFKAVQKVVASPFVLREKGGMAIYVATYYDRVKAEKKIEQLAQQNIQVTAVGTELKKEGPILMIPNCTQAHIDIITDQMSNIGLSVALAK